MGARLVMVAIELAAEKGLGHAAARLLNRMAISALDDADRPWSQLSMDELIYAMGAEPGESGKRTVMRARRELLAAGLLAPDGGGYRGSSARYDLLFSADSTILAPVAVGAFETARPAEKGGRKLSERGTKTVSKGDEKRTDSLIEDFEDLEEAPPPCPKHPSGWQHDQPCRKCAALRQHAEKRPTPSQQQTVRPGPENHCAPGSHKLLADGTCLLCDNRDHVKIPDDPASSRRQPAVQESQ